MDKKSLITNLKNISYVLTAQLITLILGVLKIFLLPILLGVNDFGYWQIYLLYLTYVGFFTFGFNDGVYLKYGKKDYDDLPKKLLNSSIKTFFIFQVIITVIIICLTFLENDPNKEIALFWTALNIPISGLTGVLIYIMQITNQMRKYSYFSVIDKILVLIFILFLFYLQIDNFKVVIIIDTLSRLIVLILLIINCRDLFIGKGKGLRESCIEIIGNVNIGYKLMIANICGMLVLGIGRFLVERFESITDYAIYSFAMSTTNLVLVFVSALGLAVYPLLSRVKSDSHSKYYLNVNQIITIVFFWLLIIYFPLIQFIEKYMSDYLEVKAYLPLVFAVIFIQGKMQVLINPFYKILRYEYQMLKANFNGLIIAFLCIVPTYFIFHSIEIIALGTILSMFIRLHLSEKYLMRRLDLHKSHNIVIEFLGILIFMFCSFQNNESLGFYYYLTFCVGFTLFKLKMIIQYYRFFKSK